MALLEVTGLRIDYGGRPAVRDVTLSVSPGEVLGIVGPSGSGKSTLLQAILGLLPPEAAVTAGGIRFRGEDLLRCPLPRLRQLRGREIGMVFQNTAASLCPTRTVWAQLRQELGRRVKREAVRARACEVLESIRLDPAVLDSYPFELSGGMAQRVGLMLAMALRPSLLLADEPTSALDATVQSQVLRELKALRRRYGTAMVLVTHNVAVAESLADRVVVLRDGQVEEAGPADRVLRHPASPYTRQLLAAAPRLRRP